MGHRLVEAVVMPTTNLRALFNALPGLDNRTPASSELELVAKAFGPTIPYRDGIIGLVKYSGVSAWERHADDEIVLVIDGAGFLHILDSDSRHETPRSLFPWTLTIVPGHCWHQIESERGISLLTVSPQPTTHISTHPCFAMPPAPAPGAI